ncbi:MAG TPA: hypothetical protein VNO83_06865 [Pseudonocardia sp.]|nr:hypothetical protein [Pseudonocardia sp.]
MAPLRQPTIENSSRGLVLLEDEHTVVVTGEEHHQDTLAWYAPHPNGEPRHVAAELRLAPIQHGRYAGRPGVEVLVEGRRVGELTHRMAQRYGPLLEEVLAAGERPGCLAKVINGRRGADGQRRIEVELRLPTVLESGLPAPGRPAPGGAPARGPRPAPRPGGAGRRRSRRPLWIAGGVAALLLGIGAVVGSPAPETTVNATVDDPIRPTTSLAAPPTEPAVAGTTTTAAVRPSGPAGAATTKAPASQRSSSRTAAAPPSTRRSSTAPSQPSASTGKATTPQKSAGGCDPNYSGCVPIASDVNCPEVDGPVRVVGSDIYRLDRDKDGVACE